MRDSYFDVTAANAIEVIRADVKKTKEARAEDEEFIQRLRRNETVRFGDRDWEHQGRMDRAAARAADEEDRKCREAKRKLVCYKSCV